MKAWWASIHWPAASDQNSSLERSWARATVATRAMPRTIPTISIARCGTRRRGAGGSAVPPRAGAAPAVGTSKVSTTRALACTAPPSYRSPTGIPACTVQRAPTRRRRRTVAIAWLRPAARPQHQRLHQRRPLIDDAAHPRPESRRGHADLEHLPRVAAPDAQPRPRGLRDDDDPVPVVRGQPGMERAPLRVWGWPEAQDARDGRDGSRDRNGRAAWPAPPPRQTARRRCHPGPRWRSPARAASRPGWTRGSVRPPARAGRQPTRLPDQRIPGQPENALGDLVPGDLGRPAGDRHGPGGELRVAGQGVLAVEERGGARRPGRPAGGPGRGRARPAPAWSRCPRVPDPIR